MVLPVTGPIHGTLLNTDVQGNPVFSRWERYRQTMPIDRPLRYTKQQGRTFTRLSFTKQTVGNCYNWYLTFWTPTATSSSTGGLGPYDQDSLYGIGGYQEFNLALNGAVESFRAEIGSQCEAMVNAIQYNQALDLMSRASMKLYKFTRAVKRGRFLEAKNIITPGGGKGVLHEIRDVSSAWLAYSYGVKPLVQDIYTGYDIVTRTAIHRIEPKYGKKRVDINLKGSYSYTTGTPGNWRNSGYVIARCGGTVEITNPNAFLASSLGLTNPVTWVWESIPFSFVVDWVINMGAVLATMCPDLGFRVINPWSSAFVNVLCEGNTRFTSSGLVPPALNDQYAQITRRRLFTSRGTSIPQIKLVPQLGVLTSLPRALNAMSLLGAQLTKR